MENWELLNQIKVQRAIKNLTQEELANEIGVTRKTMAKFFEVSVEELFELIEK